MSLIKYLPHPGIVLVLAAILMIACGLTGNDYLLSWVVFHCWAVYFYSGCTVANGLKGWLNYMIGVLACLPIIFLMGTFSCLGPVYGPAAACGIVAFMLILLEKLPFANNIPATFCGASAFFALAQMKVGGKDVSAAFGGDFACQKEVIIRLAIGITAGIILGWLTVVLRTAYGKMVETKKA